MKSILLLLALSSFATASISRESLITPEQNQEIFDSDKINISLATMKQNDGYLRLLIRFSNKSDAALFFDPITADTKQWGIMLKGPDPATMYRSNGTESSLFVLPGSSAGLDLMWLIRPELKVNDWPWSIAIAGLRLGNFSVPNIVIPMPKFIELGPPEVKQRGKQ